MTESSFNEAFNDRVRFIAKTEFDRLVRTHVGLERKIQNRVNERISALNKVIDSLKQTIAIAISDKDDRSLEKETEFVREIAREEIEDWWAEKCEKSNEPTGPRTGTMWEPWEERYIINQMVHLTSDAARTLGRSSHAIRCRIKKMVDEGGLP